MARESPVEFKMYFKIHFETVIRGHQVYKRTWTPIFDQVLECEQDTRAEAREYDANAIGVYQEVKQPESMKKTCWTCADIILILVEEFSSG